jgi:hypothetical protein
MLAKIKDRLWPLTDVSIDPDYGVTRAALVASWASNALPVIPLGWGAPVLSLLELIIRMDALQRNDRREEHLEVIRTTAKAIISLLVQAERVL